MKKRYGLMAITILWTSTPQSLAQTQETEEVFEGLDSIMEALEQPSLNHAFRNEGLVEVDYRGRMETVLLRYETLKKRMEAVPARNAKRFHTELTELLEKAPPRVFHATESVNNPDNVEIIDLRACAMGGKREREDRLSTDSPRLHYRKCGSPDDSGMPVNLEPGQKYIEDRLQELSGLLEGIAEELLVFATGYSEAD